MFSAEPFTIEKKMEIIQTSIKSWIDKYVVIYLYNGIVSIHAKWGFPHGSKSKESARNVYLS